MRPEQAVALVSDGDGRQVGLAFLVDRRRLVTCAHVVNAALGRERREAGDPGRVEVTLRFLFPEVVEVSALVEYWLPGPEWTPEQDLAGLSVWRELPAELAGLELAAATDEPTIAVQMCGRRDDGGLKHVLGDLVGHTGTGRWQINEDRGGAYRVAPGFSGGPVWRRSTGEVVGVMRAANSGEGASDAECVDVGHVVTLFDEGMRWSDEPAGILHLSGLRFGADNTLDEERLLAEVRGLVERKDARPDAVAISGDLAAHGSAKEYAACRAFLLRLADLLRLPRERILAVPGPGDVNLRLCEAYFTECEENDEEPVPPYWPKWGPYSKFLNDLTGEPLPKDRPWHELRIPESRTILLGLNSTMRYSHLPEDQVAEFGERQLEWLVERLSEALRHGWTPVMVSHGEPAHEPVAANGSTWIVSGRAPGCRIVRPNPGDDLTVSADVPMVANYDIIRVEEVCRLREPNAVLEAHMDTAVPYLRILRRVDFGQGLAPAGEHIIGVCDTPRDPSVLDDFRREVVDLFRTPGTAVTAQLVHFGDVADPAIVRYGRTLGVNLLSFAKFQLDWDPRPFVAWQERELTSDRRYPPHLYISQRFREVGPGGRWIDTSGRPHAAPEHGLLDQLTDWLRRPDGHLVVVLGAAGSGKTFLLRTLARRLSDADSLVTPIYLPLRELERMPEINEVLAARLTRAGEDRLTPSKFDYLLAEGRIALLLDGLDELTVQSNYDKAVGYLREIGAKARKNAKIVVTARDVEFLSNRVVLRELGGTAAVTEGRRALHVEDFGDDQILDFLTRYLGGDAQAAARRIGLLGGIGRFPEVARNPRMLSFIATIDEHRLVAAKGAAGELTSAELYRQVIEQWMDTEERRLTRPGQSPAMTRQELWRAVTELALRLWRTDREHVTVGELGEVAGTLSKVDGDAAPAPTSDPRVHQLGTGSLLVRDADGELGFIHRSIREWLVAAHLAKQVDQRGPLLSEHPLSAQTAQFFGQLAEPTGLRAWIRTVETDTSASGTARTNALALGRYTPQSPEDPPLPPLFRHTKPGPRPAAPAIVPGEQRRPPSASQRYSGADLRGRDLTEVIRQGADLSNAPMRGAVLAGVDLSRVNFSGADLTGADLTGAKLTDADFTDAILDGARLLDTDLRTAKLQGASLRRTALLGARWDVPEGTIRQLEGAALPGAEVSAQTRPASGGLIVAVDATGAIVASGDRFGSVWLWELESGTPIRRWRTQQSPLRSLSWSDDGLLLTAGGRGIEVWETGAARRIWQTNGFIDVISAEWSPSGHEIACLNSEGVLCVYAIGDVEAGAPSRVTDGVRVNWSAAGDRLAVTLKNDRLAVLDASDLSAVDELPGAVLSLPEWDHGRVWTWDPDRRSDRRGRTARPAKVGTAIGDGTLEALPSEVSSLSWSPDRKHLVTAERFSGVMTVLTPDPGRELWNVRSEQLESQAIRAVAWTGTTLVTGAENGELRMWDVTTGRTTWHNTDSSYEMTRLAVSPPGDLFASGDAGGVTRLWTLTEARKIGEWRGGSDGVRALAWSPMGDRLAVAVGQKLEIRDTRTREVVLHLRSPQTVSGLAWHDEGETLVALGFGKDSAAWDARTGLILKKTTIDPVAPTNSAAISPDGTLTADCSGDEVLIRSTAPDSRRWRTLMHPSRTRSVAFSPDGERLAVGCSDGMLRIWRLDTDTLEATLIPLPDGREAVLVGNSLKYKLNGHPGGAFWFAAGHCRFEPGELDPYVPEIQRLPDDAPILS